MKQFNTYESPSIDIVELDVDVITTSALGGSDHSGDLDW